MAAKRYNSKRSHPVSPSFSKTAPTDKGGKPFADLHPVNLGIEAPDWLQPAAAPAQQPAEPAYLPALDAPSPPQDTPLETASSEVTTPARTLLEGMKVVCICKGIKKSTFWKALEAGAHTKEEVNRLTGAGSGGCHGRRCGPRIIEMLRDSRSK